MMRSVLLWASRNQRLRDALPRYRFVRKAVKRFMPGEQSVDALQAAEDLRTKGFSTVVTCLGENILTLAEAGHVTTHYCDLLDQIAARRLDTHLSVKLTQLGHDLDVEMSYQHVKTITEHAAKLGSFVWIDMENTVYTESTLRVFERVRTEYHNVGVCLQAYLYRTAGDIRRLLPLRPAIRLVKGAYAEPPDVAFQRKREVDDNCVECALHLLNGIAHDGVWPVFGTHDRRLLVRIQQEARMRGVPNEAFEFHLLYGIRQDEQARLLQADHRVRVLISYGSSWFPWYMRRLAERPANVFFVLRNLI
ncbi:MAG: proline dehydrogenase family protein [Candidatus Latescibacteria bacterium]|nr:proline dehydrogenase family protein [Candidatus Latescibacterota bacterium]